MNNSRDCRSTRRDIDEAIASRLTDAAVNHLTGCEPCREFQHERAQLRELVGSLKPVVAPADFDIRLRARLASQRTTSTRWFGLPGFAFGTPAVAVAAGVVVLMGAAVLFRPGLTPRPPNQAGLSSSAPTTVKKENTNDIVNPGPSQTGSTIGITAATPNGGTDQPIKFKPLPASSGSRSGTNGRNSTEMLSKGASVVSRGGNPGEIVLSDRPFEFSLQDRKGVTRKITLPPLSFGSQQLGQAGQRYQQASFSSNRSW